MLIQDALIGGRKYLKEHNILSFNLDTQVLLCQVTGLDRTGLIVKSDRSLNHEQQEQYEKLLKRRAAGEPVAYLTGQKEFMGLDFVVTPAVLIPRPDTELMVETAVAMLKGSRDLPLVAVDVGTGSGAIAVSMACLVPGLQVHAVDLSASALKVAGQNATRHGVAQRVTFHLGNLLDPVENDLQGKVNVITANLPYIATGDIPGLMPDVKDYEPRLALDGGADGLELYRKLVPQACRCLLPGSCLLMEIGPGQGEGAKNIFPPQQWTVQIQRDLAARERLVVGEKL